ncbi:MAG: hypothetical protein WDM92_05620 [Caulobacteraceae bacterium]
MTVDDKTGTLYMPVGGPSPNYYGGDRPGGGPVRQFAGGGRRGDRQAEVVVPDHPPRPLGFRPARAPDPGRHQGGRPEGSRPGGDGQDRLHVHPGPQHGQAGVRG